MKTLQSWKAKHTSSPRVFKKIFKEILESVGVGSGVKGRGVYLHTILHSLSQEKRQMKKQSSDIMFKNVLIKFLFRTVTRIKHSILRSLFNRLKIYFSKNLYNKYNSGFVKISTPQEKKQKWLMRNQPSTRKQEHDRKPVCYVL